MESIKSDKRVEIEIDLDERVIFDLMVIAHDRDITFNSLVEEILTDFIVKEESIDHFKKEKFKQHSKMLGQIAHAVIDWCDSEDCTTLEAVLNMKSELKRR